MRTMVFLLAALCLLSCEEKRTFQDHAIYKSISLDSALYYYKLGWKQIMDEGNYSLAEVSYRQVLVHDSDFLIGKSVVGRLTLDLEERLRLYDEIQAKKEIISGDERLILDVYTALVDFTNAREQKSPVISKMRQEVFKLAEKNLNTIVHKYPEEVYMKAEYLEFLHARYGPRNALDSLATLATNAQKENPFLLGYAAQLEAEMGNFELALQYADRLTEIINDTTIPKSHAVLADIYFQMDSLQLAKMHADRANTLDPRNLDASRLQEKIDMQLEKVNR